MGNINLSLVKMWLFSLFDKSRSGSAGWADINWVPPVLPGGPQSLDPPQSTGAVSLGFNFLQTLNTFLAVKQ